MQIKYRKNLNGTGKSNENLREVRGSIAYALNKHMHELSKFMNTPQQLPQLKRQVSQIISSEEVGEGFGKEKALKILDGINNYNQYLSTLAAYISGISVGR